MSDQATTPPGSGSAQPAPGAPSTAGANPPPPAVKPPEQPISQQKPTFRANWPSWAKQLPVLRFQPPDPNFQLIDRDKLRQILKDASPDIVKRVEDDLNFLENELLRLFRDRDYEAAMQQNRYRLYQIMYILLAALATLIGSLQALVLNSNRGLLPWLAFGETLVALLATFLATISGREPPLPLYLNNRRRAESLRREYFRFLINLPPYDTVAGPDRRQMLSTRAADINRGVFPDEGQI
jgi:hypothetical protein